MGGPTSRRPLCLSPPEQLLALTLYTMRSLPYSLNTAFVAMIAAIAFAAMSIVLVPNMAHADDDDLDDLYEQIEELQELIEQLQRQLATQQEGGGTSADLDVGSRIETTSVLKVRDEASVEADLLGTQNAFADGVITDGPETEDGYQWFEIDYDQGPDGWSAGAWLRVTDEDDDEADIGTLRVENLDGGESFVVSDIARGDALDECRDIIEDDGDDDDRYRCTFDGDEIYESDDGESNIGTLRIENLDGAGSASISDIEEDDTLDACLDWIDDERDDDDRYRCTFDGDEIYETGESNDDTEDRDTATYVAYRNGAKFVTTHDVTHAEALESCMKNATDSPSDYIRCTWDGDEIYDRVVSGDSSVGTYEGFLDGDRFIRTTSITRTDALAHCRAVARQNEGAAIRCTWNGSTIYVDNENDGVQPAPSCSITATPSNVPSTGGEVKFTWTASNNTGASLWGAGDAVNPFSGGSKSHTMKVKPKTQILEVWGSGGSALCLTVVKAR